MKEQDINKAEKEEKRNVVDKVAGGERASFADEPLTPEKKIAAEQKRMKSNDRQPTGRAEEDQQKANLGGPVLTPEQKVKNDLEAQDKRSSDKQ